MCQSMYFYQVIGEGCTNKGKPCFFLSCLVFYLLCCSDKLWGAQTQRSLMNFPIGTEKNRVPFEIIQAYVRLSTALCFCYGMMNNLHSLCLLIGYCEEVLCSF